MTKPPIEELQGIIITLPDGRRIIAVSRYTQGEFDEATITISDSFTTLRDAAVMDVLDYVEECSDDMGEALH